MEPWLDHFARACFRRSADTAHDLKTPLNVAVLNLELLRMRLRKLDVGEDEKIGVYTQAIETELRRLGRIFDAFFILSSPPKSEGVPAGLDVVPICHEIAVSAGFALRPDGTAIVVCHEPRIRQGFQLFFEAAAKLFSKGAEAAIAIDPSCFAVSVAGAPAAPDFEMTRIFKFYHTDSEGNADLSLAVARLIAETYGGELNAIQDRDNVVLRLSLPLGAE
jgi:signal transduction histidine kinase